MSKALVIIAALLAPNIAAAYMGPGAGLGMLGSAIAVLAAVALGAVGLVLLPLRLIIKRRRKASSAP